MQHDQPPRSRERSSQTAQPAAQARPHPRHDDGAARERRRAAARARALLAATGQVLWTLPAEGHEDDGLAAWRAFTGQSVHETAEDGWLAAVHPADRDAARRLLDESHTTRTAATAECRVRRADGAHRRLLLQAVPVVGPDGEVREWVGCCQDVSERAEQEDALRASDWRIRATMEYAPTGIAHIALDGQFLFANPRWCQITGYLQHDLLRMRFQDMTYPEDLPSDLGFVERLVQGEIPAYTLESRYRRPDGTLLWINVTVSLSRSTDGTPEHFIALLDDITTRKQAEEDNARLLARERDARARADARARELAATFEAMTDGVALYDHKGSILHENRAIRRLLALDLRTDLVALPIEQRAAVLRVRDVHGQPLASEHFPQMRALRGEIVTGSQAVDLWMHALDGREILLNISAAPVREESGQVIGAVAIFSDVTERRALEERTRTALEALLAMAEALVSRSAERIEALDRFPSWGERMRAAVAEDAHELAELTRRVLGCATMAIVAVEPESDRVEPLAVLGLPPEQEQQFWDLVRHSHLSAWFPPSVIRALHDGSVVSLETAPTGEKGPTLAAPMRVGERLVGYISLGYGAPLHTFTPNEVALAGAIARLAALVIERERLLHERAEARADALALAKSNRRMDEFLGVAGHEMRTPLTVIKANVQMLTRQMARGAASTPEVTQAQQVLLRRTERQVDRLARLVSDLLEASRLHENSLDLRLSTFDLAAVAADVVEEQQQEHPGRHIALTVSAHGPVRIVADEDRISQVLVNYLNNALKFSPADREVDVRIYQQGGEAHCLVRDEGAGLPMEDRERIWERFSRIDGMQVQSGSAIGLGLGLYISRSIILRHGGTVGVESVPGEGSTFWFRLPLAEDAAPASAD